MGIIKMKIFRRTLYLIRIISNIFFLVLLIFMLPYIYESSWQGFLFLGMVFIYIGMLLWTLIQKNPVYQETISYNLIMICIFLYFGLITARILLDTRIKSSLYTINIDYCKNNFFLLSLIILGMILNTILLALATEDDESSKIKKSS